MRFSLHGRWQHLAALALLTLVCAIFWWRFWIPTPADRLIFDQDGDFTLHYYASIGHQMERLQDGQLAQWNPYNRAGFPHIANIQNSTFYPPRYVVAALVPGDWRVETLQWESIAHVWLASVMMYAFLAQLFRAHPRRIGLALVGALIWAYSGYITSYPILHINILESVTWLPLMLLGAHLSAGRERWLAGVPLTAAGVALTLLAGHPQVALYMLYLVVAYGLFSGWQAGLRWRWILARLIGSIGLGVGLAAIQLLPTLELMRRSSRLVVQAFEDKSVGLDPAALTGWLWSNGADAWSPLYVGVIVLLLAFAGVQLRRKETYFWAGALTVGLLFSFGSAVFSHALLYVFAPGISMFRHQERAIGVAIFSMVMLAVYGLAWLTDAPEHPRLSQYRKAVQVAAGLSGIVYLLSQIAQSYGLSAGASVPQAIALTLLLAGLYAFWLAAEGYRSAAGIGVLGLLLALSLFTNATQAPHYRADRPENRLALNADLQPLITAPEAILWRVDGGGGLRGTGDYFRVPDMYGVGPFSLESIDSLYTLPVDRFWEIFSVRYATITDMPPPNVALDLLAHGVNADGSRYDLVELQDPRPLAHLVYDYRTSETSAEFARQIMADPNITLREQAITLYPLPLELPVTRPDVSRIDALVWHTPEYLTLNATTSANALLTLSVVNYPGWQARVNGQPVDIVDTYAGLIGIPLHADNQPQTVELYFQSRTLAIGALITLISAALLTASLFAFGLRLNRKR